MTALTTMYSLLSFIIKERERGGGNDLLILLLFLSYYLDKQRKEERRDNSRVLRGYSSHLVNLEKSTFERDVASFNLDC